MWSKLVPERVDTATGPHIEQEDLYPVQPSPLRRLLKEEGLVFFALHSLCSRLRRHSDRDQLNLIALHTPPRDSAALLFSSAIPPSEGLNPRRGRGNRRP